MKSSGNIILTKDLKAGERQAPESHKQFWMPGLFFRTPTNAKRMTLFGTRKGTKTWLQKLQRPAGERATTSTKKRRR